MNSFEGIVPYPHLEAYVGESDWETIEGKGLGQDANDYLLGQEWCENITSTYVGLMIPPILGVLLVQIESAVTSDHWQWIVAGDLPFGYLNYDSNISPNPACALRCYTENMRDWTSAIFYGTSLVDVFPVEAEPTEANAKLLSDRLNFIENEILSGYSGELRACDGEE